MMQATYTVELVSGAYVKVEASDNASIERIKEKAATQYGEQAKDVIEQVLKPTRSYEGCGWQKGRKRKGYHAAKHSERADQRGRSLVGGAGDVVGAPQAGAVQGLGG